MGKLTKIIRGRYGCTKCCWQKEVQGDPEKLEKDIDHVYCPRCGCAVELTLFGPGKTQKSQIMEWPWPREAQA